MVANDRATVSIGWNAISQVYFDQTEGRLNSVGPVEGTASQINFISEIAKASEPEATRTFINYPISPEAQTAFAKAMFYAPTNKNAEIDEVTAKRIPMMDPAQQEKLIKVDWTTIGDMRDDLLQPWRRRSI